MLLLQHLLWVGEGSISRITAEGRPNVCSGYTSSHGDVTLSQTIVQELYDRLLIPIVKIVL